jgi:2-hydroxychromene-2-carboxylate isomerase
LIEAAPPMPKLDFWFDYASTYSYLSAMRIEELARAAHVDVVWRPFLLGPIFNAQGWETSPFKIYPAKGRYMVRDMERTATERGLPLKMPAVFPANSLLAARLALVGEVEGWIAPYTRAVFDAGFGRGEDIGARETLAAVLASVGIDPAPALEAAASDAIKAKLRAQTEAAQALGIFGAPTFVTEDGELFWGDDRLEQAIAWANNRAA